MEDQNFDALVARLASGLTRRGAISALAAAGAGQLFESAEARKKKKKVTICRNGQTLSVTKKKKRKHLKPGDAAGPCPAPGTTSRPTTTIAPRCQPSAPNFCARLDFCVDACPSGKVFDLDSCACICPAVSTCCSCVRDSEFLCFQRVANAGACETACSAAGGTGATFAGGNGGSAVCDFGADSCRVTCEPEAMACSCSAGTSCCEDVLGGCCPIDTPFCCPLSCCAKDGACCSSTDNCGAGEVCQTVNLAPGGCCVPAP